MDKLTHLRNSRLFKKGDIIVAALLIAVVVISLIFLFSSNGSSVEIYSNGQLIHRVPLQYNARYEVVYSGERNYVVIANNSVHVEDSTCRDLLCENKTIANEGQTLVCLPNKLIVKIVGKLNNVDGEV